MATTWFFTYRISNLPLYFEERQLPSLFALDDVSLITSTSLAPATNGTSQTATVTFRQQPSTLSELQADDFLTRKIICSHDGRDAEVNIQIDMGFHGLTPLNTVQDNDAVVLVALTGLAGRAFGSWQAKNGAMWLRDYLPGDIANLRIFTYGYPSKLFRSHSTARLLDFTINFMDELKVYLARSKIRRLILVGHSMGCLIIKQALCECEAHGFGELKEAVITAVFFGPPHRGLNNPQLQECVLGTPPELLVQDLRKGSSLLTHLNTAFATICRELIVITCFELLESPTIIIDENGNWKRNGQTEMMVDRDSACLYIPTEQRIPVHADHSRIAKLLDAPGSEYHSIKDFIAQVVGEVSGVRFRASRLFQYCLAIYKILVPVFQGTNQLPLADKFRIEVARFELWGRLSEIVVVRPSLGLSTAVEHRLQDAAERMLQLLNDLTDENILLERFGIKVISYTSDIERLTDLQKRTSIINTSSETSVHNIGLRINHLQLQSCVVSHIQKAQYLLETLHRVHNSMISILQLAGCQAFDQLLTAALLRTNANVSLSYLEDSRGGITSDISKSARLKSLELETKSGILQRMKSSSSLKVSPASLDLAAIPKNISRFATWQTVGDDQRSKHLVFIEWRYYDRNAEIAKTGDITVRVDNLMKILTCSPRPTSLCILDYFGYFHDFNHARFGFVCNLPEGVSSLAKQPHRTLNSLLCDNSFKPSLTDRFHLAKALLQCIHQFHLLGWLHKGINSQNVLFFKLESEKYVSIRSPFLTGFDLSREDNPVEISERSPGDDLDIYRYAACRLDTTTKYKSSFDIYALGLALLEIGFWRPLVDLAKSENAVHFDKVLPSLVDQVRHRAGDRYHKVLQMCIRSPESEIDEFAILEKALIELDYCSV